MCCIKFWEPLQHCGHSSCLADLLNAGFCRAFPGLNTNMPQHQHSLPAHSLDPLPCPSPKNALNRVAHLQSLSYFCTPCPREPSLITPTAHPSTSTSPFNTPPPSPPLPSPHRCCCSTAVVLVAVRPGPPPPLVPPAPGWVCPVPHQLPPLPPGTARGSGSAAAPAAGQAYRQKGGEGERGNDMCCQQGVKWSNSCS